MTGPMRPRARFAAVGLAVLLAFSLVAAWGRKPPKEDTVKVTMRHVTTSEATDILRRFPDLVPDFLVSRKDDTAYMAGIFGFVEVTAAPLTRIFPTARFYRGHDFTTATNPYLMAIAGNKGYGVYKFNQLLLDNGLKVTDKNMVELAKVFVVLAIIDENRSSPAITFLDARRTSERINGYNVKLETKTGERVDEWYVDVRYGGFALALRGDANGIVKQYLFAAAKPPPKR